MPPEFAHAAAQSSRLRPCCRARSLALDVAPEAATTCGACGAWWSPALPFLGRLPDGEAQEPTVPANDIGSDPVDAEGDVALLASWLPAIGGFEVPGRSRWPDHVSIDLPCGLQRALAVLTRLDTLARVGVGPTAPWRVLWWAYVVPGPMPRGGLAERVTERFAPPAHWRFWKGHKSRHVRDHQIRVFGGSLLAEAQAAYEDVARGIVAAPATRLSPEHPTAVARRLAAHFDRSFADTPKPADSGFKPAP